jgi:protein involved in polysaccharide export with SLBB domain
MIFSFIPRLSVLLLLCLSWSVSAQVGFGVSTPRSATSTQTIPSIVTPTVSGSPSSVLKLSPSTELQSFPKESADAATRDQSPRTLRKTVAPTQFQQFVQEATGRKLDFFGADLFESPETYASDANAPPPADYVLGPGDEVRVQIWGAVDYNGTHTLDRNGQISLPKMGVVVLSGVPVRNLEAVLRSQVAKVFTNFEINANLGRLRSIQIYVVGQAQQPGTYRVSSVSTLVNAVFASGGPTTNGSMRNIQLKRAGRTITTLDLYDFIAKGEKGRDVPLQSGDVIVIPPVGPRIAVAGAFDQAAIYELKLGASTVGDILSLSGGVPALASTRKALLERIAPEKNPPRQVQDIALDVDGLKQPMRDGDVLTLLNISPAFANAVTLQGTVAAPLRYRWFEGMRILDLIPERDALITQDYYRRKNLLVQNTDNAKEAGGAVANRVRGLADQINWEYAVIERLDKDKLSTELVPFNLGRAVLQKDPAHNLVLLPGDVVTILSQSDLSLPQDRQTRLVRVEGEVGAPGVYQTKPGETLVQLLQRVGGITSQAYLFGAEFSRESVRLRQQENLAQLARRLEAQLQAQTNSTLSNLRTDNATQAQAIQQQQAQVRSQIERIRTLRSNGRVALELDPQVQVLSALPDIPLEDGDRILIPPRPGFVAAFGSVYNENVFIHKSGKTVSDVIKSAGLVEDAEPNQAFVLRADGSIISRRDRGSFFGGNAFESIQLMPGDTVVIPAQLDRESRYNFVTRALKDWTQIFANFGLGVAAIRSINSK